MVLITRQHQIGVTADKGQDQKHVADAVFLMSTKFPTRCKPGRRALLLKYVLDSKITTDQQLNGMFDERLTG